jgi:hypothetical protein
MVVLTYLSFFSLNGMPGRSSYERRLDHLGLWSIFFRLKLVIVFNSNIEIERTSRLSLFDSINRVFLRFLALNFFFVYAQRLKGISFERIRVLLLVTFCISFAL